MSAPFDVDAWIENQRRLRRESRRTNNVALALLTAGYFIPGTAGFVVVLTGVLFVIRAAYLSGKLAR